METRKDVPIIAFENYKTWMAWLAKHHANTPAVWAKIAKKGASAPTATYEELREGALIYGWIDGLTHSYDEQFYLIRFTPRRPKGNWSKINRTLVEELIAAGKMQPTGLAQVEAARADGRWDAAYDSPGIIEVPADFLEALDKNPKAKKQFQAVNKTNRYSFLYRIQTARTPEARARYIQKAIEMLTNGKLYHPPE